MKSEVECLQHAAKCWELAERCSRDIDRAFLLTMAHQWHALADQARRIRQRPRATGEIGEGDALPR